ADLCFASSVLNHLHFHNSRPHCLASRRSANLAEAHGNLLQRLVLSVEKPCAEVSGPSAVGNRGAHYVRPLVESEPLGDAIVNDGLAIAINTDDLFAVDPPHRRRVGTDSQSHITHLARAIDNGYSPEQNIGGLLALRAGEVKEVDVIVQSAHRMPGEFRAADGRLVAIVRYDRELIRHPQSQIVFVSTIAYHPESPLYRPIRANGIEMRHGQVHAKRGGDRAPPGPTVAEMRISIMSINRRDILTGLGALGAMATLSPSQTDVCAQSGAASGSSDKTFPRKSEFAIPAGLTYINGAYTHPMPVATADAVRRNAEARSRPGGLTAPGGGALVAEVKEQFASLINAKPSEISFTPNTSTGENLVFNSLGIIGSGGNVVTDALHFDGMILHLQAIERDYGLDLRIAMPRDGRIEMRDLEKLVDKKTKLVEVSLVAMYNGFQHDLKAVCDLAHGHGGYVYADIVQAAGATPIDVRASGVDFCSCSSFKWLMGDFGLGFLYAREDLLGRIRRSQYGYHSARSIETHFLPYDPPASAPFT